MKKFIFVLALSVLLGIGTGVSFADVQIDEGQSLGTAAVKFFVGRVSGHQYVSKDRVVIWDTTSKDGVTVTLTTTSEDRLVAGITLDAIQGASTDTTETGGNWGRIQTWGLHNNVPFASGQASAVGEAVCSSTTAGALASCYTASVDNTQVGITLEAITGAASTTGLDIFVKLD